MNLVGMRWKYSQNLHGEIRVACHKQLFHPMLNSEVEHKTI